ncbi:DUF1566 domain-containing protein [Halarcobacter sp.]|uniref:Lcl C-terminal domain-containing protein n=1 Tax=Halarcobacter sp. TaxID=2321133 RepID=UPI002AA7F0D4|nr:DUF1566 domain-containing protein [Halarcobacter sp.]
MRFLFLIFIINMHLFSDITILDGKIIQWQDFNNVPKKNIIWDEAKKYCKNLKEDGFSDWKLPTIDELFDAMLKTKDKPNSKVKDFTIVTHINYDTGHSASNYNYWTINTNAQDKKYAWTLNIYNTNITSFKKTDLCCSVRCVRIKDE